MTSLNDPAHLAFPGGGLVLDRPRVMGILNVTPDSFSDGGRFLAREDALANARKMIAHGADVIDIGAESTRPGAVPVPPEEEWRRLAPVLSDVVALGTPVSIDTYKAPIARDACRAGAVIVNDVWGLQKDPGMADAVAEAGAAVIMMHNRLAADAGIDILDDIDRFFERSLDLAERAGIAPEKQMLDPGIGFGKTLEHNLKLIASLEHFVSLGLPVLFGASRKRFINAIDETATDALDRLGGSLTVALQAARAGCAIVRVHDVRETAQALKVQAEIARYAD